ncbi:MAG: hypothetical protein Ct9H300mP8_00290 [Gammaproteobacteria bacterium]|nr:MAG: hypothetical protein Ct9H300mP8_00290 [Gammaproteobacteria bacterium]
MSEEDHPLEPFKRAPVATMRALAENDELEVTFGKGAVTVRGDWSRYHCRRSGVPSKNLSVAWHG